MKLRPYPAILNGNKLETDQFGFHAAPGSSEPNDITFMCRGRRHSECAIRIKRGAPDQAAGLHGWDGNMDEPTITPSIGCDHRCGWHGHIIKGEIQP